MAQLQRRIYTDYDDFLTYVEEKVLSRSISATLEESVDYLDGDKNVAIRVFERYSYTGNNRLSLHLTIIEEDESIYVVAITTGGSQARFFKINTFGESSFLDNFENIVREYEQEHKRNI